MCEGKRPITIRQSRVQGRVAKLYLVESGNSTEACRCFILFEYALRTYGVNDGPEGDSAQGADRGAAEDGQDEQHPEPHVEEMD